MSRDLNHCFASVQSQPMSDMRVSSPVTRSTLRQIVVSTLRKSVFWRNGIGLTATEAPTSPGPGNIEGFFVTIEYEFHGGIHFDLREFVDELDLPENSAVRKEILQQLNNVNNHRTHMSAATRTFKYTVGITRDQLDQAGGVVYIRDLDLVVGYEEFRDTVLHPYSQPAMREQLQQQVNFNDVGNHHRLVWVDNTQNLDPMWYNNGLGVFEIKPITSPHLKDGFYLYTRAGKSPKEDSKYLPLEKAEKDFLLYRTRADAEVHGKPDKAFGAVITQLEHELSMQKVEVQRQKLDVDREQQILKQERELHEQSVRDNDARRKREQDEHQAQIQRQRDEWERQSYILKMEREQISLDRKAHSERMGHQYDMESRYRKDQSDNSKHMLDMAKLALGMLSVGMSIYAVYQKSKKD